LQHVAVRSLVQHLEARAAEECGMNFNMEIRYVAISADIDIGLRSSKRVSAILWTESAALALLALASGYLILHRITLLLTATTLAYGLLVRFGYLPWMFRRRVKT